MMKKVFIIVVEAVWVFLTVVSEGWMGAIVLASVYAIGRLVAKMAYRKSEDPNKILFYISIGFAVLPIVLSLIPDTGDFPLIIFGTWFFSMADA